MNLWGCAIKSTALYNTFLLNTLANIKIIFFEQFQFIFVRIVEKNLALLLYSKRKTK